MTNLRGTTLRAVNSTSSTLIHNFVNREILIELKKGNLGYTAFKPYSRFRLFWIHTGAKFDHMKGQVGFNLITLYSAFVTEKNSFIELNI